MSQDQAPHDEVLGKLDAGPHDSALQPPAAANEEPLALPEGAILAFRKSGGLRFNTRTLVVYAGGDALYMTGGSGMGDQHTALELSESQQLRLRRALTRIDFSSLPQGPGRASPDAYVYELAVRTLGQTHSLEAWDGSIPPAIKPLLEELRRVMPNQ